MVLDIQGIDNILRDPGIATEDILDTDDEFLFCLGNLTTIAIQAFLAIQEFPELPFYPFAPPFYFFISFSNT